MAFEFSPSRPYAYDERERHPKKTARTGSPYIRARDGARGGNQARNRPESRFPAGIAVRCCLASGHRLPRRACLDWPGVLQSRHRAPKCPQACAAWRWAGVWLAGRGTAARPQPDAKAGQILAQNLHRSRPDIQVAQHLHTQPTLHRLCTDFSAAGCPQKHN